MGRKNQRNYKRKKEQKLKTKITNDPNLQEKKNIIVPMPNSSNETNVGNSKTQEGEKVIDKPGLLNGIIGGIISGIVVFLIGSLLSFIFKQSIAPYSMKSDLIEFENSISTGLSSQFEKLEKELKEDINIQVSNIEGRVDRIENILMSHRADNVFILEPVNDEIIETAYVSVEMEYVLSSPIWKNEDIIFKSINNDTSYSANDLNNEKILVTYKTGNKENYFYGQYNENNQWSGDCIINVYEDDNLIFVIEAVYDNGTLLTYRQINKFTTKAGINVWNISSRTNKDNYTCGENRYYFRGEHDYKKIFTCDDVIPEDIITIDSFENKLINNGAWLEGYYYGNTQNGHFNDNTGNAFMIKYFEDGTIRTFYVGNFENGDFSDITGNAWYITRDINTEYMYYKGIFMDGHPADDGSGKFEHSISPERINNILLENNFDIKEINSKLTLNWNNTTVE